MSSLLVHTHLMVYHHIHVKIIFVFVMQKKGRHIIQILRYQCGLYKNHKALCFFTHLWASKTNVYDVVFFLLKAKKNIGILPYNRFPCEWPISNPTFSCKTCFNAPEIEEINQLTNQNIDLKKFDFKNVDLFQSKSIHAFPD